MTSALPPVILSVPPSSNHTSSLLLLSFCQKWLLKFLHHACSRFFTFFSAVCLLTVPFHCLTGLFIFHSNCTSLQHSVCSKGTNNQSVLYLYSLFIYTVNEVTQSIKADPFLQESLCHPHRNNYFAAVLFQITSTWIHLCYSDIWCVTRKKILKGAPHTTTFDHRTSAQIAWEDATFPQTVAVSLGLLKVCKWFVSN